MTTNAERPVSPDWLQKMALELPDLAAFIRAELGPIGWEYTVLMWAERLQRYVADAGRFDPEAVIRQEVRDRAQRAGIDAYYNYLETLAGEDQDKPWAVTNALLHCINASLREAYAP